MISVIHQKENILLFKGDSFDENYFCSYSNSHQKFQSSHIKFSKTEGRNGEPFHLILPIKSQAQFEIELALIKECARS